MRRFLFLITMCSFCLCAYNNSMDEYLLNGLIQLDSLCVGHEKDTVINVNDVHVIKTLFILSDGLDSTMFSDLKDFVLRKDGTVKINTPALAFYKLWFKITRNERLSNLFDSTDFILRTPVKLNYDILYKNKGSFKYQDFIDLWFLGKDTTRIDSFDIDTIYTDKLFSTITGYMEYEIRTGDMRNHDFIKSFLNTFSLWDYECTVKACLLPNNLKMNGVKDYLFSNCLLQRCSFTEWDKTTNFLFRSDSWTPSLYYDYCCVAFIRLWYLVYRQYVPSIYLEACRITIFCNNYEFE